MLVDELLKDVVNLSLRMKEKQSKVTELMFSSIKCSDLSTKNGKVYQHLVGTCVVHELRYKMNSAANTLDETIEEILSEKGIEGGIGTVTTTGTSEDESILNYGNDIDILNVSGQSAQQATCSVTVRTVEDPEISDHDEVSPPPKKKTQKKKKKAILKPVPIFIFVT